MTFKYALLTAAATAALLGSAASNANQQTNQGPATEGIEVHGHWILKISNPDGSLDRVVEFDNALTNVGAQQLVTLFMGEEKASFWLIRLGRGKSETEAARPCNRPQQDLTVDCDIAPPFTLNPGESYPHFFNNLTMERVGGPPPPGQPPGGSPIPPGDPDDLNDSTLGTPAVSSPLAQISDISSNEDPGEDRFDLELQDAPPETYGIRMQGTITIGNASEISEVSTRLYTRRIETDEGSLVDRGIQAPYWPFTIKKLETPEPVTPGQTVDVSVTISFQ